MDSADRIAALSAYFDCDPEIATTLDANMSLRNFRHKEILLHQGDQNSDIWLVLDGSAQLQVIGFEGQLTLVTAHGPGEIFGAIAEVSDSKVDVIVNGQLSALQISAPELQQVLRDRPSLGIGLSKILGSQFNAILDRMAARITLTAIGRVYSELLRITEKNNTISPPPVIAALALTAQTTRETASRAINALARRGIIEKNSQHLAIVSRRLLEDLVV